MGDRKLAAVLPDPTEEVFVRFAGTGLILQGADGPAWTQKAVDFAGILRVMQVRVDDDC